MKQTESLGQRRRQTIVNILNNAESAVTGAYLAKTCGVSRQVIVQDIALIKAAGIDVMSTRQGYRLAALNQRSRRLFKLRHNEDQVEEELTLIVDRGGCVEDTIVNHRTYGPLRAPLGIANRRDIGHLIEDLKTSKSSLLSRITDGYHFHHISAATTEQLDEIEEALNERGFLVEWLPWEHKTNF